MRWRAAALVGPLALLVTLILAGCGGLSTSGPVEPGLEVGSNDPQNLRVVFPGPVDGASQESIVRGFIRAGAASDGVYDNARRFLTSQMSEVWNPDETIVLLSGDESPSATLLDPATVQVTAGAAGTIDVNGRFTAAAPGATVSQTFGVVSVGGQWRISSLPEGMGRWISRNDVSRLVQPYPVHYISTSAQDVVPDVRWFPLDKLATRLARAQLDPVPDYLADAASTAVPVGSRLLGDAVSIDGGVATVDLISGQLEPTPTARQDLWAQFVATLTQDTAVTRVSLSVEGVPVDLPGLNGSASSLTQVGFPPSPTRSNTPPVVRRGSEVVAFDTTRLGEPDPREPEDAGDYPQVAADYRDLAQSADGAELAAVDPGGEQLSRWRDGNRYEVPQFGTDVGHPAYDQRGFLWAGGVGTAEGQPVRLWAVDTRADPADPEASRATPVSADWLSGRRVEQARVAADGDRVVVLSTLPDGSSPRVDLTGIVRGERGVPEHLALPLQLGSSLTQVRGLSWVDDRTVAVLGALGDSGLSPTILTVGGEVRTLTEVPNGQSITATGGERDLWVITTNGRLLGRSGAQWLDSGPATDLSAAAG
ncbi:MAG: GerMN domain-containing protein [Ornithinibacter sp.]